MSQANYYDSTSDNQSIGVRMRPDLQVQKVFFQSEPWWIVKDPHDQQYHKYNEQEFAILGWLDGKVSFSELREKFDRQFSPFRVSYRELTTIIREFFKKSVVVSTRGGNGLQLHEFSREKKRDKLQKKLKNILAIQFRGWDPTRFMELTYPKVSWFFSKTAVRVNLLFFMAAMFWLLINYDEFVARLPNLWSLLDNSNLVALGLTIAATKLLHELGHGYVHKRFGGECHEIGVMIFFLVPTMYCNTSDSWMLPDKWKRMAIAAAGVYVELVIFSIATFTWWFSGIGLIQDLSLNLMVICSISAAFTNGNPLMRYDGYFVLADWLEIPNLSKQSNKEIRRRFLNQCLGIEREVDYWTSRFNQRVFLAYGLAAFVYRTLLILAISYLLIQRFQFAGLANFGLVIAVVSFASLFVQPFKSMYNYFKQPGNWQHVGRQRAQYTAGLAAALVIAFAFIPTPFYIPCECSVELSDQQTIFAVASGRLETVYVQPGDRVKKDQPLVQMIDEQLHQQILEAESQLAEVNLKLRYQLTPRQTEDVAAASSEETATSLKTTQRKLTAELEVLNQRMDGLLVRAPLDGFVYGLTIGEREADTDDENLNQIFGNPLHSSNLGGWLERGDEICQIGADTQPEIVLLIEQSQNGLVRRGQDVSILLSSLGSRRLSGQIAAISLRENRASDLPTPIFQGSSSPMIAHVKQAANADKRKDIKFKDGQTLGSTMIQATVELTSNQISHLNFASVGRVRIFVGYRTCLWRSRRALGELFQRSF